MTNKKCACIWKHIQKHHLWSIWRSPLQHMLLVKPVLQSGFQFGTCTSRKMWTNHKDNKEVWEKLSRTTKHIYRETLKKWELFSLKREVTVFQTYPIKVFAKTKRIICSLGLPLTEQKVVSLYCSKGDSDLTLGKFCWLWEILTGLKNL